METKEKFNCGMCNKKSINKGYFWNGSNNSKYGKLCQKCEKEIERQNKEDSFWYDSVRL